MRKGFLSVVFASGVVIGVAVSALGEQRLIPPIGTTQPVADSRYVNESGDTMTGALTMPAGSKSAPSIVGPDADTGIYWSNGGTWCEITVNGSDVLTVTPDDVRLPAGSTTEPSLVMYDLDTGFAYSSKGQALLAIVDGQIRAQFDSTGIVADTGIVCSVNGVDHIPGSDIDADLITVNVTGIPKMWWDEATDSFEMNKSLTLPGGSLLQAVEIPFSNTDDGSSGSGVNIPASANILDMHLLATTDFTSGGTPTIDVGFTGDKDELVDGIDIDTQTNILLPPPTATIDKWAVCTGGDVFVTCTTCTGGAGTIRVTYAID